MTDKADNKHIAYSFINILSRVVLPNNFKANFFECK